MSIPSRVFFPDPEDRTATVLVVEDEILIRMAIAAYLQECGFKVLEAGSAAEAREILEVNIMPVDLVFSDVIMPGDMNGCALANWIHDRRPELPVILTSGQEENRRAGKDAANSGAFFTKPYDVAMVAERIRLMIDGAHRG